MLFCYALKLLYKKLTGKPCGLLFCTPRPAARGVQRESRKRGEGGWRARRSRARASLPPVSNRGVQIAYGQPFFKAKP